MSTLNNAFPQGRSQAPAVARHNVTFAQILYEYIQPSTSLAAKLAKTHERRWCIEATKTFLNSCISCMDTTHCTASTTALALLSCCSLAITSYCYPTCIRPCNTAFSCFLAAYCIPLDLIRPRTPCYIPDIIRAMHNI